MKGKKYPKYEEEARMVNEPVAAATYQKDIIGGVEDNIPVVIPATWEEALMDIEQSEKDFAEGRCSSWEDVKQAMAERI